MQKHWYESDWFLCLMAAVSLIGMVIGNWCIHGGHLQW